MIKRLFFVLLGFCISSAIFADDMAPEFNLAGKSSNVRLSDLKGKVVYLDFWASWCVPCRKSFPWMNSIQEKYKSKGLVIVGVNVDAKRSLADEFLNDVPSQFTIAFDPDGKVADAYQVKGMPSSYLIDRKGRIQSVHLGFRSKDTDELEAKIKKLVESSN